MRVSVCEGCKRTTWVNVATRRTIALGEFCAECWEYLDNDPLNRPKAAASSGPNHSDPGFENAVRILEDG